MTRNFRHDGGDGLFAPLNLAAYVTWIAVSIGPLLRLRDAAGLSGGELMGLAGSLGFLLLFAWRAALRSDDTDPRKRALVIAQIPAVLLALAGWRDGMQPVLMIVVAGQASMMFAPRALIAILLVANLALAAVMLAIWPAQSALPSLAAYLGFQAFAWLLATYARRAEFARDAAQRLNTELLAARELLAEGARAGERLHLSRELHDVAGQKLTALKMQLALLEKRAPVELTEPVRALRVLADELLSELRAVVGTLRRDEGIDLHRALAALAQAFPHPQVVLDLAADARAPDLARAEALLRAAQESLTNAARHSGAQRVEIRLRMGDGQLVLEVRDDGRGLRGVAPGHGLTGMRERLDAAGGTLALADQPGGGLRLQACVPLATVP